MHNDPDAAGDRMRSEYGSNSIEDGLSRPEVCSDKIVSFQQLTLYVGSARFAKTAAFKWSGYWDDARAIRPKRRGLLPKDRTAQGHRGCAH
jgi:hypothetical protein